jgi:hypothetical protein
MLLAEYVVVLALLAFVESLLVEGGVVVLALLAFVEMLLVEGDVALLVSVEMLLWIVMQASFVRLLVAVCVLVTDAIAAILLKQNQLWQKLLVYLLV